jgi:hypothetical protein
MANKNIPSLDGLIQTKGAPRPDTMTQRGESPAREIQTNLEAAITQPAPASRPSVQTTPAVSAVAAAEEPRAKSLTLRLSQSRYERLRNFAFSRRQSHQDIIEVALLEYLDRQERGA